MNLDEIKAEIAADVRSKIKLGIPVDGMVLPLNPLRIEVIGKSADSLEARIIYSNVAPYYLRVKRAVNPVDFILNPGDTFQIEWSGQVRTVIAANGPWPGIRIRDLTPEEAESMAAEAERARDERDSGTA